MTYTCRMPYGAGNTLQVAIASSCPVVALPNYIEFRWSAAHSVIISVEVFQTFRYITQNRTNPKIECIKALRGFNNSLGLKEAKDITEWFFNNFEEGAGVSGAYHQFGFSNTGK